jgi:DNA-binding GntR family transcriptional regulator
MQRGSIRRETLETQVYQVLRKAILEGQLAAGERLVQDEVATKLGTSRIPVRDALKRLEVEGLVTADERGSYSVSLFGVEDLEEIYNLRALLEPYAAAKAIPKLTASELGALERLVQEMAQAAATQDLERYVQLNQDFHIMLYEATKEHRLVRMIKSLWSGLPPLVFLIVPGQLDHSEEEHKALLQAVKEGNVGAVEDTLRMHIQNAGQSLKAQLQQAKRSGHSFFLSQR